MKCHVCSYFDSRVIESRDLDDASTIRRRRQCLQCDARFTTYERLEMPAVAVVKKDGRREIFNREKVAVGIYRAVEKRPITPMQIEELIARLERQVRNSGESEITSTQIGELVLEGLQELDDVAYVRFASVYRSFNDMESFEKELHNLRERTK